MRFVGVIPARYASSRLPGKPLLEMAGRPLIRWVYEAVCRATRLAEVWIATDDQRIYEVAAKFGARVLMTRDDHVSGTDRVAEVAGRVQADVFINIQGDEPLMAARTIDAVCEPFESDSELQISTAAVALTDSDAVQRPHVVKVVIDRQSKALYFSRSPIPYPRRTPASYYKHVGIYGYRRRFLLGLSELKPSPLEYAEGLEQLRFLENGVSIRVVLVEEDSVGIDTPEDVERVRPLLENIALRGGAADQPRQR